MTDSFWLYLVRRLLYIPVTLFIITATLYGLMMVAPPEERASLYLSPRLPRTLDQARLEAMLNRIVEENGLNDPYPVQYGRWAWNLLRGDWGYSPTFSAPVLELLQARAGTTLEIALYALLLLIPMGLVSGLRAGWRPMRFWDWLFRGLAYIGGAIPPFILGLFLLSIFYVGLGWFSPGRLSNRTRIGGAEDFIRYTGFLTLDGLINGRPDVAKDALNHLVLPVVALSVYYWATLGRVTRASTMDELGKSYILAARARGLGGRRIMWRHTLRNVLVPGYTSMALAAASIITGVFVVEVVFNIKGLSELITTGFGPTPDAALVMGFAVYSVLLVVPIMFILDLLKSIADPRLRRDR
ncbi:MAG: ABC transporter permease [Anaerolineales bacterium]|nr:ABC transporter permease [Anaerolineales bacterium]MCB0007188.1 ABC transporter permease [Anaerolineales bacterium]MCB0013015.1 ABC transporter permease [Anaerolineales bacterium]MCB0018276.1 ABC transporter permease [Anaerolineales bacterium]MCB0031757.1 ABC transporter permease [Anaerolineales bacterium]